MPEIAEDRRRKIQEQLDRILSSTTFSGSERHRRFLRFVVEQALKGDTDKLNEFVLGFEVFNKNDSFDPRIDSIVRVEARRLRERLRKYYEDEGRNDPLVVTLRPRSFVPEFEERSGEPQKAGAKPAAWLRLHKTVAIAAAAIVCGAIATTALIWLRWGPPELPKTASVIVLPFQSLTPGPEHESLGDRVTDALISGLAERRGLRVISRASGIQFKESGRSPYAFAAELHVDYIIEGTVRADAGRVVISAKMTDTHTQSYVWAETRESDAQALADLERDLTNGMVAKIRLPLPPVTGDRPARRRSNPEAYGNYLKGQYYWYQWDRGSVEKSIALFEKAIASDPDYAPAWAWLSQGYQLMIMRDDGRDAAMIAKGKQAAQKALALDDQLAEAYAAVGSYAALDWDWGRAEQNFQRAVQLNPGWAQGHLMYGLMCLLPTGQLRHGLGEVLHAHELDPLTRTTRTILAEALYMNRQYARVIAESADLRKPSEGPGPGDRAYFLSLSLSGQGKRALAEMGAVPLDDRSPAIGLYGYLVAKHGDQRQAREILRSLLQQSTTTYVSPVLIAIVAVGLGDKEEAFRQLRTAVARHVPMVTVLAADPIFDPLRSDARYAEIIRQIGLQPTR
jgi:serine/threonine-protein kinase